MEIIVGTYEHYVLGYKLIETADGYELQPSFSVNAHSGSVRSLASSSKYFVSGSTDENVCVYNMKTRKEIGALTQHEGTVTCLKFFLDNYLFSGSEDKTICVWSTSNWQCQKTLRGHKNGVVDLSVHPSGKLLLSVAKDKTLKTWNLIKGRSTYVTNVKSVAQFVEWSPDGVHFVVVFDSRFDVYSTLTAGITYSIDSKRKFGCFTFVTECIMAIAENEDIAFYDIRNKCLVNTFTAHENRLKTIICVLPPSGEIYLRWLITISSDAFVKIWEFDVKNIKDNTKLITQFDTACRPTSLTVWGAHFSFSADSQTEEVVKTVETKAADEQQSGYSAKPKKLCKNKAKN